MVLCEIYLKVKNKKMTEESKCFWLVRWGENSLFLVGKELVFDIDPDVLSGIQKYRLHHAKQCQRNLALTPTKRQELRERLEACEGRETRNRRLSEGVETAVVSPIKIPGMEKGSMRQTALMVSRMRAVLMQIFLRRVRAAVRSFKVHYDEAMDDVRLQSADETELLSKQQAEKLVANTLFAREDDDQVLLNVSSAVDEQGEVEEVRSEKRPQDG